MKISYNRRKARNYHHVRIGTINVRTTKCESKLAECVMQIKALEQDVCCMQETRIVGQGEIEFDDPILKGWKVLYNGMKGKAQAGVAIVLAPHVKLIDVEHHLEARISLARIVIHGTKICVVSCYSPTEEYANTTKDSFYNNLSRLLKNSKKAHPSYKSIVCGDFNATIGTDCPHDRWQCIGRNNDENPTSYNGNKLLEVCDTNLLYILNTMFDTKSTEHRFTYTSPKGYKRRLDYIIAEWYIKRATRNCRSYPGVSAPFDSDHRMVVLDAMLPTRRRRDVIFAKKKPGKPCPVPNVRHLRESDTVRTQYSKRLDELLKDQPVSDDSNTINETIVDAITKASTEVIPPRHKMRDSKPWVNDEFLSLVSLCRRSTEHTERKELSRQIKKMRTSLKAKYFKEKAGKINEASEQRHIEEEFRLAKNYSSLPRKNLQLIHPKKLQEHFATHLGPRVFHEQPELLCPEQFPHVLPPEDLDPIDERPPDTPEVVRCFKNLNNGKCQGTDGIFAEQLKYAQSPRLFGYFVVLLGIIWSCLNIPVIWLKSAITCLHKKGSKSLAENYRGLSIIATMSKVLAAIVVERIRSVYECILLDTQFGFRKNRSTCDAIFITRHILEKEKQPLFLCFIDLKAAYDWIPRVALFRVLEIRLSCPKLVSILKALYTGTKACIKGTAEYFETLVGCRQGALESPLIFNIYMDFVVRCAKYDILRQIPDTGVLVKFQIPSEVSPREYRQKAPAVGVIRVTELLYADDLVIFSHNADELSRILAIYDSTFSRFGLQMSYTKTETMAFNVDESTKARKSLLTVNNTSIKNVREFKYLGHLITNTEKSAAALHSRIASAFQKWDELKQCLTDKEIYIDTRMKILNACVRSRLLYGIQTYELSATDLQKIETIWNGFLRKMVTGGYSRKNAPPRSKRKKGVDPADQVVGELDWSFKISNERLRQITNSCPIRDYYHAQYLKYMGHVCRLQNNSLQKQVLFDIKTPKKIWSNVEALLGVDVSQARRTLMDKTELSRLLSARLSLRTGP